MANYLSVYKPFSKEKQVGRREKKMASDLDTSGKVSKSKLWPPNRKPIKKVSKKQAGKIRVWSGIKIDRVEMMIEKFGCVLCEYCLKRVDESEVEGHHNDHLANKRSNNTPENCRLVHPQCNTEIEDKNIKDVKSLL